jgi:hypothetical protein
VPHPLVGNPIVGLAGLTVSPAKSIFLYSPPVILALIGLRRLLAMGRSQLAPLLGCLVIHVALVATLKFWAGEWAWGPRYLVATLPLACIGLPFAWVRPPAAPLRWAICVAGVVVQLLAISVDHQRYYVERSLLPFFWVDETTMYRDSPLLARPRELTSVLAGEYRAEARGLVPGPLPYSMTSALFGPAFDLRPYTREWMRRYLVFLVPRPWTFWAPLLPRDRRPGPTGLMTAVGAVVALAAFGTLAALSAGERRRGD